MILESKKKYFLLLCRVEHHNLDLMEVGTIPLGTRTKNVKKNPSLPEGCSSYPFALRVEKCRVSQLKKAYAH